MNIYQVLPYKIEKKGKNKSSKELITAGTDI